MKSISLILICVFVVARSQVEECRGKSDICLLLDGSGSIDDTEWNQLLTFAQHTADNIHIGEDFSHVSVIQFSGAWHGNPVDYRVETVLSSDHTVVTDAIWACEHKQIEGWTYLNLGLQACYNELTSARARPDAQKFVIAITDGMTQTELDDMIQSDKLENDLGALIFGIGITNEVNQAHIRDIVASPTNDHSLYTFANSFLDLEPIVDILVDVVCTDIYMLTPNHVCMGDSVSLDIFGHGFINVDDLKCRFDGNEYPAAFVTSSHLTCDLGTPQNVVKDELYEIDVSVNSGRSWTDSHQSILFHDCNEVPPVQTCVKPGGEICHGHAEIIFVLDSSYSVENHEWDVLREFTYNVTRDVCIGSDYEKVSIIEFSSNCEGGKAKTFFDLSDDRSEILRDVLTLGRCAKGTTPLHAGLNAAKEQIVNHARPNTQPYVVVISDAITDSCIAKTPETEYQPFNTKCATCLGDSEPEDHMYANCPDCCFADGEAIDALHDVGAVIVGVVVGKEPHVDHNYVLNHIATSPDLYAETDSFDHLQDLVDLLVEKTCIEVYSFNPGVLCQYEGGGVEIHGTGFVDVGSMLECKLMLGGVDVGPTTFPLTFIDKNTVKCELDYLEGEIQTGVDYVLEISIDSGIDWTNSGVTLQYIDYQNVICKDRFVCYDSTDCPGVNSECNTDHYCECEDGYRGSDPNHCEPVCEGAKACGTHSTCVLPEVCECEAGYVGDPYSECEPECTGGCGIHATCVLPQICECDDGYDGTDPWTAGCQPVCLTPPCVTTAFCVEPEVCMCLDGYGPVPNCPPICDSPACPQFAECVLPQTCQCITGYSMQNDVCEPVCNTPACVAHATCTLPDTCQCDDGYAGDGKVLCEPVCSQGCGTNAECIDPEICACLAGYEGDPETECLPVCSNGCPTHGFCSAPETCTCEAGYGGILCEPVCEGTFACHQNAECTAPQVCECLLDGYSGDGYQTCDPVCDVVICAQQFAICSAPNVCSCVEGYAGDATDECLPVCEGEFACGANSECIAPDTCECFAGYEQIPPPTVADDDNDDNDDDDDSGGEEYIFSCRAVCGVPCTVEFTTCVEPDVCGCIEGYEEDKKNPGVCVIECPNPCVKNPNAYCPLPNICRCLPGYVSHGGNITDLDCVKGQNKLLSSSAAIAAAVIVPSVMIPVCICLSLLCVVIAIVVGVRVAALRSKLKNDEVYIRMEDDMDMVPDEGRMEMQYGGENETPGKDFVLIQ